MPASEATVKTQHPGRYLTQLCTHASKMGRSRLHRPRSHADGGDPPAIQHAEWSATDGTVILNWGQWTMRAAPGTLTLRAEADDEETLRGIQDLITARLEKIGRRDHLAVNWQPAETPASRTSDADLLPGCLASRTDPMRATARTHALGSHRQIDRPCTATNPFPAWDYRRLQRSSRS